MSADQPGLVARARRRWRAHTRTVSLAARVAVLATAAVALTLGAVSALVYLVVEDQLIDNLDDSIRTRAEAAVKAGWTPSTIKDADETLLDVAGIEIYQVEDGRLLAALTGSRKIRPTQAEMAVSIGTSENSARTAVVDDEPYRVVAVQAGNGSALIMVQPMDSTMRTLERLGVILIVTTIAGVAVAGLAGWQVAANGLRPVRRLTAAAEHVARTHELEPIAVSGRDELARLTIAFNQMLVALDASQEQQRQLVADAGHELRTPLTSLRTNVELIGQISESGQVLSPEQRREILGDIRAQVEELTTLIGDLVELARDEPLHHAIEPVDLADVTRAAVDRVRLRFPALTFAVTLEPWMVVGEERLLERAVTNLLDNAGKWSPADGTVRVVLAAGALRITDEGPGIAPEDLPRVFERFYRSSESRTLPGSGLGLSIVLRAAERHGGTVTVDSEPGLGSTFTLVIPASDDSSGPHTAVSEPSQR